MPTPEELKELSGKFPGLKKFTKKKGMSEKEMKDQILGAGGFGGKLPAGAISETPTSDDPNSPYNIRLDGAQGQGIMTDPSLVPKDKTFEDFQAENKPQTADDFNQTIRDSAPEAVKYKASDLKDLGMGSAERVQAYKDLNWAQDHTTTGHGDYVDPNAPKMSAHLTKKLTKIPETGDDQGPVEEAAPLSRRELRQQGRRDRKSARVENLQRKRENLSEPGDPKYKRLLSREHRLAAREAGVGEGARKFRERRDKVMGKVRDSKVGRFFKGNTSDA